MPPTTGLGNFLTINPGRRSRTCFALGYFLSGFQPFEFAPVHAIRVISRLILFVADLFQPVHGFAVELFLNGDMRHGGGGRGAVPMFLARWKPDHVARPDFFNRPAPALRASAASGHNQSLAERMRVPCGACAGFKRDDRTANTRGIASLER